MAIYRDGALQEQWTAVPNALFRAQLPLRAVAVLGNLLTHRADFAITVERVAEQLGVTRKTVGKALDDLEERGLVERVRVDAEQAGQFARNDYVLHEGRLLELPGVENTHGEDDAPRVKNTLGPRVKNTPVPRVKNTPIENQDKKPSRTTTPPTPRGGAGGPERHAEDFADWYSHYPRKVGRKAAEKAYLRARRQGVTAKQLADGLLRSIRSWQVEGRDKTKLPYPATWLNQGRWDDEETLPVAPGGGAPGGKPLSATERLRQRLDNGPETGPRSPVDGSAGHPLALGSAADEEGLK